MLGKIGMSELIVVLIVALIIFGPSKLPALGKMAGKALGTIRHYTDSNNWDELLEEEAEEEEAAKAKKKAAAAQHTHGQAHPYAQHQRHKSSKGISENIRLALGFPVQLF